VSTTFNNNDETRDVNFAFCHAQLVQSAKQMPFVPSPFNLMGLPSRMLVAAVRRGLPRWLEICRWCQGCFRFRFVRLEDMLEVDESNLGPAIDLPRPRQASSRHISVEKVVEYVVDHLAEADSENRWRSNMVTEVRTLDGKIGRLDGKIDRLTTLLAEHLSGKSAAGVPSRTSKVHRSSTSTGGSADTDRMAC
jgi:hypothetical protein